MLFSNTLLATVHSSHHLSSLYLTWQNELVVGNRKKMLDYLILNW
jgi:hypothetical protein